MTREANSPLAQATREADRRPLEQIDVSLGERFRSETVGPYFARLRRDDSVHWCPDSAYGPYWSVTRYADLIAVEKNFEDFSSAGNVIINDVPPEFDAPAFATADPPGHTAERAAVAPALGNQRVSALEDEIRHEIGLILDALPVGEPFDWVERVSVELTTRMVAALFDFPRDERHLLPYWAEVLVTGPGTWRAGRKLGSASGDPRCLSGAYHGDVARPQRQVAGMISSPRSLMHRPPASCRRIPSI